MFKLSEKQISLLISRLIAKETSKAMLETECDIRIIDLIDCFDDQAAYNTFVGKPHFFDKSEKIKLIDKMGEKMYYLNIRSLPNYLSGHVIMRMIEANDNEKLIDFLNKNEWELKRNSTLSGIRNALNAHDREIFNSLITMMLLD